MLWTGEILLVNADDSTVLTDAGGLFAQQGSVNLAQALYLKALENNPNEKAVYTELGKLYGNMERWDQALAIWQKGLQRFPDDKADFKELIDRVNELKKTLPQKDVLTNN